MMKDLLKSQVQPHRSFIVLRRFVTKRKSNLVPVEKGQKERYRMHHSDRLSKIQNIEVLTWTTKFVQKCDMHPFTTSFVLMPRVAFGSSWNLWMME